MLGGGRLANLIAQHAVTSTRTSLYPRAERFADYVFVSAGADVLEFGALPDEVSDHAPLSRGFALS
jgi:endonuclease/exonuclease/phosphatase family metal-dependent hydrolase